MDSAMGGATGFEGLRIGLVGPLPPPAGGMAGQTRQLAELLRAAQAEVTLVATNSPYRPHWVASFTGVRAAFRLVGYIGTLWRTAGRSDMLHLMANSGWSWHLFALPALLVGWLRRVPVVVNYRGGGAAQFLATSQRQVRLPMKLAAALIVPSGFLVEVFARFGMRAEIVPNIVDLARFEPRAERRDLRAHLIVTRHLEALYDNASAIRALALLRRQLPQATLTIAGSGPEGQALRALAAELSLADAVRFTGTLDRDELAALLREADLMLNPSLADNMPNSVLEAMASGVPVVSTDVGGVPHIVRHGQTGMLVPPGDPQAMAAAAEQVLTEPGLWSELAAAARHEVQRYTWPRVAERLAAIYRHAVAARPATPAGVGEAR